MNYSSIPRSKKYVKIYPMKQANKQPEKGRLQCAVCGKGVQHANLVSFSKRRIKKVRKPNLHVHHLVIEGVKVKIKVCTTCKRSLRETQRAEQVAKAKVSA